MRRANDFYPTPAWATEELLRNVTIEGFLIEPCVGDGAILQTLKPLLMGWLSNDFDPAQQANDHRDASLPKTWESWPRAHWVVTNPPFTWAPIIVPLAYDAAVTGIAMLLRLSFLEPVENRGSWLNRHPPTRLVILPRISFTGDGKTDNVTCAWMIWEKGKQGTITVAKNPKFATPATQAVGGGK